jgi:hypothetical protein
MSTYEPDDLIKVEFSDQQPGVGEWMWVRVRRSDAERQLVFGVLLNEALNNTDGKLRVGSELAISFDNIREHRKPYEFDTPSRELPK